MAVFTIREPEIKGNEAIFRYTYADFAFTETHTFPFILEPNKALYALAIASSVSYYKLHLAKEIHVAWQLSAPEIVFWEWLFKNGFSELVFQNKLEWSVLDSLQITSEANPHPTFDVALLREKAIVGIGGGKDSSVAVTLLQKMNIEVLGFATETRNIPLVRENTNALCIPFLPVTRTLDPQLHTLRTGVYLGHIPISLVYAFTGIVIALHEKSAYVFVGNETSADESNTEWLGRDVNHQWSKSSTFEKTIQEFVHTTIHPSLTYASILRPFGGLRIAKMFTEMCPNTFSAFSSCNRNFTITKTQAHDSYWCGACAKCLGTYILLAPYISKDELHDIFPQTMAQDTSLLPLMRELVGLSSVKPFDCVATRAEMRVALHTLPEHVRVLPLFRGVTESEWQYIEGQAKNGTHYMTDTFPHFLPEAISAKLFAVL